MDFVNAKNYILDYMHEHLSNELFYHGISHTWLVFSTAGSLCVAEKTSMIETKKVLTAALLHDIGFVSQYEKNEEIACDYCRDMLPQFNYCQEDIDHICEMIMATEIPQHPEDLCAKILCDADLHYLGTDDYFKIALSLRTELKCAGRIFEPVEWLEFQIKFIEAHTFHTSSAIELYEDKKRENLVILRKQAVELGGNNG